MRRRNFIGALGGIAAFLTPRLRSGVLFSPPEGDQEAGPHCRSS